MTASVGWSDVVGQIAAVAVLRAALGADEVGHAWLLVGPAGVGQAAATRALAAALNCPADDRSPDEGCGACSTCRRIATRAHPAVRTFEPEGASHRVAAVREEWIPAATTTPVEGRTKVLRIAEAGRMNETAQNAFLKVLEEPPETTVWVLEVADEAVLLETVVSRCRRLDFTAPGRDAMRQLAGRAGLGGERRDVLARAAMGSPSRLTALAEQPPEPRATHLGLLRRLVEEGPGAAPSIAGELLTWSRNRGKDLTDRHEREQEELLTAYGVERRRDLPPGVATRLDTRQERERKQASADALVQVLDDLASYLRDLLAVRGGAGREALVNLDHVRELDRDAELLDPSTAAAALRRVAETRDALDRNGNSRLQLERLLLFLAVAVLAPASA